jgi:hypothetical protein
VSEEQRATAPAPPAARPQANGDQFREDVVDWMSDLDQKINALGRAVAGLVDASTKAITGQPATPDASPTPTQVVPNAEVKRENAERTRHRGPGLFG